MDKMKSAIYSENSDNVDNIKLVEVPKPTVTPGYAVVKVCAASVNPIDHMVMAGYLKGVWAMPLPFAMGYDFSGVIDAIDASDADKAFAVGDEVFAVNWGQGKHDEDSMPVGGAFSEFISIPISKLSKKPAGVTFEEAAAVALVGTTAYQILFDCAKIGSGSKVLILGGASAVGSTAIQLAKAKGAWVATTCSSRTRAYVEPFGADRLVDYKVDAWDELPELKGIDAVIDCVGERDGFARTKASGMVKDGGAFVSIASQEVGYNPSGHPPFAYAAFHCLRNDPAQQDELAAMVASKTLKINIYKEFAFTESGVREMLKEIKSGQSMGKIVLKIA